MGIQEQQRDHLYHIQIIKTYLEYIRKAYPDLDTNYILEYAGLTTSELRDNGYWCTQEQTDRFQEVIDRLTSNPNIAREAGRYGTTSSSYELIRQYILSFIEPAHAYELLGRIGSKLTRGTKITINRISSNKVEAVFELNPGVQEKPYQCLNRLGMMEAMAMSFTGEYAMVEHVECIHKGAGQCKYSISWNEPAFLKLRRLKKYLILASCIAILISSFLLPFPYFLGLVFLLPSTILGFSSYVGFKEKQELRHYVEKQGRVAEQFMAESNKRYNDAELIQELGQAISRVLDVDELLSVAMETLKKHLAYDRGMILLANPPKTLLKVSAGYGYPEEQLELLKKNAFHLENLNSKGPFVVAFRERKPYLVNDVEEIIGDLSARSKDLVKSTGARSFICVPIVYEDESLGVLSLDNTKVVSPPKQSDLNLLMGIAPQIAICINNARTFERMQASEEKYRILVESANSIILRIDTQGVITFTNRFAQEFYGYDEHEMIGKSIFGLLIPEKDIKGRELQPVISDFLINPQDYKAFESENILRNKVRVWVSWSNKAIYARDGVLSEILCVGNDITARKKAEFEKKDLEEQLIRAQKMEAIGALAGGVAHDLNNILSGITSYPELLLMEIPDDSPMKSAIHTIKKSGDKAAAIVQDLLTLARRGVNILDAVDLNFIVTEYAESLELSKVKEYHPHINFRIELDNNLKYIMGSGLHLSKALMNLVSNAAEAIRGEGTITINTAHCYLENPRTGYETVSPGEYAVLSVTDTGIGISKHDLKKIFEPFFSKKVMGKSGTGLGMTVVWSTVKDHNGYIDVDSHEGEGTRFDLFFPVTRHVVQETQPRKSVKDYSGTGHILIVDDEKEQCEITKNLLKKLGYQVDIARNGEEAVELLKERPVDLIILDMIMDPGIDGLETYKRILEIRGRQKAIIVSGFSETESVREALTLGIGSYLPKPFGINDLAEAVWTELNKKD